MNDSESDPYESGQNSERSDISDDNDSHQETELHDNSDVISLEAESDGERLILQKVRIHSRLMAAWLLIVRNIFINI